MRVDRSRDKALTIETNGEEETRALAARLAAQFTGGEVVGLRGDLGVGKTVFVQGLARGLDAQEPATSPSFVIAHQYPGRLPLHHVDLYRLEPGHVDDLGLEELMTSDAVVAIEWCERLPERLRGRVSLDIAIEFGSRERDRTLRIRAVEETTAERLRSIRTGTACCDPSAPPQHKQ
ncbi:MAG: tRNA (adenosine(37)-N6)-threonylcarbamoyltransferase complex ATPase subunit type 1 TsaE [Armatimonadota bacterium]|nr:MAG: tRNA (adenosine(37)-N6)-threonylcarbamoyltransferase complex ATPase subunit type 1 TsaE [Armatimonadota bacterium]